jgi:S1-C subfamily serine protease
MVQGDYANQTGQHVMSTNVGTGFLVGEDGYLITANHVINLPQQISTNGVLYLATGQPSTLAGFSIDFASTENFKFQGNFTKARFSVVDRDVLHDLVLLKLGRNPFKGEIPTGININNQRPQLSVMAVTLSSARLEDGLPIGVSGYPLGEPVLVSNFGFLASSTAFQTLVIPTPGLPPWMPPRTETADVYLADLRVNHGDSGAPVYGIDSGEVIGVCVGALLAQVEENHGDSGWAGASLDGKQLGYNSGVSQVVPSRYVLELLRKNGVSPLHK